MPEPQNRTAFVFLLSHEARVRFMEGPPSKFYEAVRSLSPRCENLEKTYPFPQSFTVFQRSFGHADRYVADGVALLGDAAHPVTPAGGQGANMSVADATVLGQVAFGAFKNNDFSKSFLSQYEALRRQANERSLQFSVGANRVFRTLRVLPWCAPLLPWLLKKINRSPKVKSDIIRSISNAFVTCPNP